MGINFLLCTFVISNHFWSNHIARNFRSKLTTIDLEVEPSISKSILAMVIAYYFGSELYPWGTGVGLRETDDRFIQWRMGCAALESASYGVPILYYSEW